MKTMDLGKVAISPKGEYDAGTQYHALDIISHDGSSYLVLKDALGITPAEGEHYQLMAKKAIGKKRAARVVIGTSTNGWTEDDCDYLCDGTDDQVEINAAINKAYGGEVIILDGEYHISSSIKITGSSPIILRGSGHVLLYREFNATSKDDAVVRLNPSYSRIINIDIDGNYSTYSDSNNYAIELEGTLNYVESVNISNSASGIYMSIGSVLDKCIINTKKGYCVIVPYGSWAGLISNCYITGPSSGVSIYCDRNVRISGCTVYGNIDITANVNDNMIISGCVINDDIHLAGTNVLITGNYINARIYNLNEASISENNEDASGANICSNVFYNAAGYINLAGNHIRISDNWCKDTTYYGNEAVALVGYHIIISGNMFGVRDCRVWSGSEVVIVGNVWYHQGTAQAGTSSRTPLSIFSRNTLIANNIIYGIHTSYGIACYNNDCIVIGNLLQSVYNGIGIHAARNIVMGNTVICNTSEYPSAKSIHILTGAKNTAVLYNMISLAIANSGTSTTNTGNITVTV